MNIINILILIRYSAEVSWRMKVLWCAPASDFFPLHRKLYVTGSKTFQYFFRNVYLSMKKLSTRGSNNHMRCIVDKSNMRSNLSCTHKTAIQILRNIWLKLFCYLYHFSSLFLGLCFVIGHWPASTLQLNCFGCYWEGKLLAKLWSQVVTALVHFGIGICGRWLPLNF